MPVSGQSQKILIDASEKSENEVMKLPSGGGHDSMNIKSKTEVGMLFARSRNGISHSPNKWTSWDDCKKATRVLANAVVGLSCES
jgi:N-carbamoyl-L-amino-acid hydrolase